MDGVDIHKGVATQGSLVAGDHPGLVGPIGGIHRLYNSIVPKGSKDVSKEGEKAQRDQ